MTLGELIDRLSTNPTVDGLAVIGSGADGTMNDVSGYDLLIVLDEPPLRVTGGVTQAEGRMVDIVFSTVAEIDGHAPFTSPTSWGSGPPTTGGTLCSWPSPGRSRIPL